MGRPKKIAEPVIEPEDTEEVVEIVAAAPEEVKNEKDSITLVSTGKDAIVEAGYERTFSRAQHGEDWEKAAEAWKNRYC